MNKFLQKIVAITQSRYMRILTNGFMAVAAISIAGSIFNLLKSIPITPYLNFLSSSGLGELLSIPVSITSDLMAVYIVLSMAYTLAKEFKQNAFAAAVVSMGAFMILTPFSTVMGESVVSGVVPVEALGAKGVFLAILVGLLASRLYVFFLEKGWKIKMPDSVPDSVAKMFEMMIPGGLVFVIFLVIRGGLSMTSFETAQNLIYAILQTPLMYVAGGLLGAIVYVTVCKILWIFGVHGGMVTYAAMATVIKTSMVANQSAFATGEAAPYPEWAWAMMILDFSILSLTLVMLITAKSKQYKTLGKLSLPTSLFNITEPVVFGFPLIMNPVMAVPFVLLQPVNLLLTVLVSKIGWIHQATGAAISVSLPTPIQAAFINAHWSGFVWALILIVFDCIVWYPFFKAADKKAVQEEMEKQAEGAAEEAL